jgi:Domain of unknown function (DUF4398)
MKPARAVLGIALAMCAGCVFMPRDYARLDEARRAYAEAQRDPVVAGFAPNELKAAEEVLERAGKARDTLDDPAIVDHLAYLARQRVAIAREAARMRSFDRAGRAL